MTKTIKKHKYSSNKKTKKSQPKIKNKPTNNKTYYYLVKSPYFSNNIINNAFKIRSNWKPFNEKKPQQHYQTRKLNKQE